MELPDGHRFRPATVAALTVLLAAAAVAVLWSQVAWTWPYFSDDSFISLRYSERLLEGKGLTWNDGERVEGYSNLLWVLGCAGLGALGLDLVTAARLLGVLCAGGTLAVLLAAFPPRSARDLPAAVAAPLVVTAASPLAVWTCGGLEGSMVLLWATWGSAALLALLRREGLPGVGACVLPGLPFALLCLTRPDGPLWVAASGAAAWLWWWRRSGLRPATLRLAALGALPALAVLGQLAFRLAYYGDWLPNTAHVKTGLSWLGLQVGWEYVRDGMTVLRGAGFLAAPALALLLVPRLRGAVLGLLLPVLAMGAYLIAIGGDHFLGWRHLFAPLGAMALLGALGLQVLGRRSVVGAVVAWLPALAAPALLWVDARTDHKTAHARDETWEWQGEVLGRALGAAFGADRALFAVDGAGALPFFSGLPCIDMLGLNDRTIARTPPGLGIPQPFFVPGHMHGNGGYVMDRQPDLMLFGRPPGLPLPVFVSAVQFETDPRFLQGYRCVLVELPRTTLRSGESVAVRAPLWVRLAGRAGAQAVDGGFDLPAYLLGSYRQPYAFQHNIRPKDQPPTQQWTEDVGVCGAWYNLTPAVAVPGDDGRLRLELRADQPAVLSQIELPAGAWSLAADGPLELALGDPDGGEVPRAGAAWQWRGGPVDVVGRPAAGAGLPVRAATVRLRREP